METFEHGSRRGRASRKLRWDEQPGSRRTTARRSSTEQQIVPIGLLADASFQLRLISSVALARTREALHNGGTRTTRRTPGSSCICSGSARPDLLRSADPPHQRCPGTVEDARRRRALEDRDAPPVLTHHLPLYFPEIERFRQTAAATGSSPLWSSSRRRAGDSSALGIVVAALIVAVAIVTVAKDDQLAAVGRAAILLLGGAGLVAFLIRRYRD